MVDGKPQGKKKGRKVKLALGALNLAAVPHPDSVYEGYFREAIRLDLYERFWGNKAGQLGPVVKGKFGKHQVLVGEFHLFTDFDLNLAWFDRKRGVAVSSTAVGDIQFLKDKKPEHAVMPFYFFIEEHVLVFEAVHAPFRVAALVEKLFGDLAKKQEQVLTVTPIQEHDALKQIFGIKVLEELVITLAPPNAGDDGADAEKQVMEKMKKLKAKKMVIKLSSDEGLQPDKETVAQANLALRNGSVEGKGKDENNVKKELDTAKHPVLHVHEYNSLQPKNDAVRDAVSDFIKRLFK